MQSAINQALFAKLDGQQYKDQVKDSTISLIEQDLMALANDYYIHTDDLLKIINDGSFFGTCFDEFLWVEDEKVEDFDESFICDLKEVIVERLYDQLIADGIFEDFRTN